jgi:hypothetical protein
MHEPDLSPATWCAAVDRVIAAAASVAAFANGATGQSLSGSIRALKSAIDDLAGIEGSHRIAQTLAHIRRDQNHRSAA